jgi:hypothetical protein
MKYRLFACFVSAAALLLSFSINARTDGDNRDRDRDQCRDVEHNEKTPLEAIGIIPIPGVAVTSTDIAFVDAGTERLYFSDRSNKGVDVIDAENDTFVGRVSGFAGNVGVTNGSGPGGVLVAPGRKLWAGDGDTKVREADVDPASSSYLKIINTVDISIPACGKHCNRADEVGFDPKDHKVMAAVDQPSDAATGTIPIEPYAALINATTLGVQFVTIPNITKGGGLEQPLWDGELGVFFLTVPSVGNNPASGHGEIALINPKTGAVVNAYQTAGCGPSGEVLAPFQRLVVECGGNLLILNAHTGKLITTVLGVPADELWFNPGDDLVYSASGGTLYVVDPQAGAIVQKVSDPGGRNQAAFAENNHVFTPVRAAAGDQCSKFGFVGTGCVAVFAHVEKENGGR